MTKVKSFTFSPYFTNCFVCYSGLEAVIVDASCAGADELSQLNGFVTQHGLKVRHLLLTHAHIDHILGCAAVARAFDLSWTAHRDSKPFLTHAEAQATMFGTSVEQPPLPGNWVSEGDVIEFGKARWAVLHTPGHAPGSICFVDSKSGFAIVGDVLFNQSIGRTDLPGGDMATLMASIYQKLLVLPANTVIYSGHGPPTTVGDEKRYNPFLQ